MLRRVFKESKKIESEGKEEKEEEEDEDARETSFHKEWKKKSKGGHTGRVK